ncbi:MAG: DegT/DnrJ/EryC1/StrS family aminotransferase [Planctomycetota bacterium]|jgi:dTDP-4-amino-4,6-dideoxygalactose transaminase
MAVPFVNLKEEYLVCKDEIDANIKAVIENTAFIGGDIVKEFEALSAEHQEVNEVAACGSCTTALWLTLKALGVGEGDEVITTACTAIPTTEAITLAGAKVVFADIAEGSFNISAETIAPVITDKTKAILPVHLYGIPCDMAGIMKLAEDKNLLVLEDCAQAQGARIGNTRVGNFGDAACFSYFPSKNLGGFGDGGAMTAGNSDVVKQFRMIANHGRVSKLEHGIEGVNSRLDAIQAAALLPKLKVLDKRNDMRNSAAKMYAERLAEISDVKYIQPDASVLPIWHIYPILTEKREELQGFLKTRSIASGIHYAMSLNLQEAYSYLDCSEGSLPCAEKAFSRELSLPMFPSITEEQIDEVCSAIREFFN